MRVLFTIAFMAAVIWWTITHGGSFLFDRPEGVIGWGILILGSFFAGLIVSSVLSGIIKSFQIEFNLLRKYSKNKHDIYSSHKGAEPSSLGFMSGGWFLLLIHLIRDTWKSFFTEVQWAYKAPKARNLYENVPLSRQSDPIFLDEVEGERLYQEWLDTHSSAEKFKDFFKFRIINGTVFVITGSVLATIFSLILIAAGICSLPYILVYLVAWFIDRLYLIIRKIAQPCGNCQSYNLFLNYECPKCGAIHKRLVPGPYGVFVHTCKCGQKMPCTFFNGRSVKSKPKCPVCNHYIKGAGTRPFMIQLIGGSNSGKTVYISAFYHEFLQKIKRKTNVTYSVNPDDEDLFTDLDDWYNGVPCASTEKMNSQMYPVEIISKQLNVARKFILYDIAGEMFNSGKADNVISQKQFHYCNGIVFILDPFSNLDYRSEIQRTGDVLPQYSDIESEDVINTFLNYLSKTGNKKIGSVYQMPFSVVITKSDVKSIRQRINMVKIKSELSKNPNYTNIDEARDGMCREFLNDIGLSGLTSVIETRFKKVHYFLASPMGHEPDGSEFESWGVVEPVEWIIREEDEQLFNAIFGSVESKSSISSDDNLKNHISSTKNTNKQHDNALPSFKGKNDWV